jgi:hypothetical protein
VGSAHPHRKGRQRRNRNEEESFDDFPKIPKGKVRSLGISAAQDLQTQHASSDKFGRLPRRK